jgi:hypothetical protein
MAGSEDGRGLAGEVKHEDGLVQETTDEVKATYKSFK